MDTFIIVVMLCTWNPGSNQEACTPMVEEPKVYYKTEKECEKISPKKRKEIKDIALQLSNEGNGSIFYLCSRGK
jgi:hypothetical protein